MQSSAFFFALAGLAFAVPQPQGIDIGGIASVTADIVTPTYAASNQTVTLPPVSSQAAAAAAAISTDPASINPHETTLPRVSPSTSASPLIERSDSVEKRDGTCAPQPLGAGPVAVPDTADSFAMNSALWGMALNAPTPAGYLRVFSNITASLSASNFMGLYVLRSYDTLGCQSLCDQKNCAAFNIYAERDPSLDPNAVNCPNPPSTTNYICTLWGVPVSANQATNFGQWRDSFHVLISASNAYNKAAPPNPIPGFDGPIEFGGAINAPQGYMGYKYYPFSQSQGYTPPTCAAACLSQTAYNQRHHNADGTYQTCIFFNSYVLSKNGVPQGLYCSLYSQIWTSQYANNYGQYSGSDRYTVSESYGFTLQQSSSSTQPSVSVPTFTTCYTPTTIPSPTCRHVSVPTSTGPGNTWFGGGNWDIYFAGQGLEETLNNPGNVGYFPQTVDLPGNLTACAAIQQCADKAARYTGTAFSFDVHHLDSERKWDCVLYYDFNRNPAFFNVENCDVSQSFGYTITGTSDYVPPCYGPNNPDCPQIPQP